MTAESLARSLSEIQEQIVLVKSDFENCVAWANDFADHCEQTTDF